jgi:hypothetical protein
MELPLNPALAGLLSALPTGWQALRHLSKLFVDVNLSHFCPVFNRNLYLRSVEYKLRIMGRCRCYEISIRFSPSRILSNFAEDVFSSGLFANLFTGALVREMFWQRRELFLLRIPVILCRGHRPAMPLTAL